VVKRDSGGEIMTANAKIVAKNASRVARQNALHEQAIEDVDASFDELLREILQAALPALPALCSPVVEPDRSDRSGLCLVRGDGENIWWLENGTLLLVGDGSSRSCDTVAVCDRYGRAGVVDAIMQVSVALDAQIRGNKQKSTEKIRRQAEKVRALAVLARGLS
jgi:hypothetical protein